MKTTQTTQTASRKPAPKPKKPCVKLHPAEVAGMAVHQKVEAGVSTVRNALLTVGTYGFKFVTGLVKGH